MMGYSVSKLPIDQLHIRYIFREIFSSSKIAVIFVFCVALSISSLSALNSFKRDIEHSLKREARELNGGDVILQAPHSLSHMLEEPLQEVVKGGLAEVVRTISFYSVIRENTGEQPLFVNIKAVEDNFPLFGDIVLESGAALKDRLQPGKILLSREAVDRLEIGQGARVVLGEVELEVGGIYQSDPTRPVSFLSFGPGVYIDYDDAERTGLLGKGSRVRHEVLLKIVGETDPEMVTARLKERIESDRVQIDTAGSSSNRISRFFDNLLFFLSCISILTLMLGGAGMQGSLSAIFRQKEKTIGIIKAMGASRGFIYLHYLFSVLILGFFGIATGVFGGIVLKYYFPILFEGLLPDSLSYTYRAIDFFDSVILGIVVVTLFSFLPLYRLSGVKPSVIFRKESRSLLSGAGSWLGIAFGFIVLTLLIIRQLEELSTALYFIGGLAGLIILVSLVSRLIGYGLRKFQPTKLLVKQALRSIFRQGNATNTVVTTLACSLAVLLMILLLRLNLFSSFIHSYPPDAPNLFCIDIQVDQVESFQKVAGGANLFPVVRARLLSINGRPVDTERELERRSDNLAREFNLTYRNQLLPDERIKEGQEMYRLDPPEAGIHPVSILDYIADVGDIKMADILVFNIAGVELKAQVSSIRTRTQSRLSPFFYFVFEEAVLKDAPQTFFAALTVPREEMTETIRQIVKELPNISIINVAELADKLGALMVKLARIVTFFSSFSILAGCFIMISSLLATKLDRIKESVYYKILGADSGFVLRVLIVESMFIALLSFVVAFLVGVTGAYLVCIYIFDIEFQIFFLQLFIAFLVIVSLITTTVILSSWGVVSQKPAGYLRQLGGH